MIAWDLGPHRGVGGGAIRQNNVQANIRAAFDSAGQVGLDRPIPGRD